jgi:hypothetical protein
VVLGAGGKGAGSKIEISDLTRFAITVSIILLSLAYAHIKPLQKLRFVLVWLAHGFSIFNELLEWILAPLTGSIRLAFNLVKRLFTKQQPDLE